MVQFVFSMGQSSSIPKARRKSLRTFSRRSHTSANLSHTFALNDDAPPAELLNINQASEEELMTLAGFGREVARSVIDHRRQIGRFRRVEDLALVRGVGADRLEAVRGEICVGRRAGGGSASSRAQSYDSLRSADSRATIRSSRLVNVNKASVFELQGVQGMTQEIAAAIVTYREKRGPFKQIGDLIKVKGMDRIRLNNVLHLLTIDDQDDEDETPRSSILTNGFHVTFDRKPPLKMTVSNGLSTSSLYDIFDLLSAYSPRPILEEIFKFKRQTEPAIRIASWNLFELTLEKANNPGVKEVICRTILENGLSIIAVQDVVSVTALKLICEELNRPTLRRVNEWKDKNHNWNFCMLDLDDSKLGFIYDSDGAIDIELISLNQGPENSRKECEVVVGSFKLGDLSIQLVNLKVEKLAKYDAINTKIKDLISEEDFLLLFADFSNMVHITDDWLKIGGLRAVLPTSTVTSYQNVKLEATPHHISNILFNTKVQAQITGSNGVIRQGLTHLAIPNGWNWGGPVSPYCPIWTELFLNSNLGTAL